MQTQNETTEEYISESLSLVKNKRARLGVLGGLLAAVLLASGTQKITENPSQQKEREVFPRYALVIPQPIGDEEQAVVKNLEEKVSDTPALEDNGITYGETVSCNCFHDIPVKRKISSSGIGLIKRFEGFSAEEYPCQAGKRTIGYGHVIQNGEKFGKMTEREAEKLLREDLRRVEKTVNDNVKVFITQRQYDAVCSFIYNAGIEDFTKSTFLRKLNEGDYSGAANQLPRWRYVKKKKVYVISEGLENRRAEERARFLGN